MIVIENSKSGKICLGYNIRISGYVLKLDRFQNNIVPRQPLNTLCKAGGVKYFDATQVKVSGFRVNLMNGGFDSETNAESIRFMR